MDLRYRLSSDLFGRIFIGGPSYASKMNLQLDENDRSNTATFSNRAIFGNLKSKLATEYLIIEKRFELPIRNF
jgi:hypothetical protein